MIEKKTTEQIIDDWNKFKGDLELPYKYLRTKWVRVDDIISFIRLNESKGIEVNGLDIEIELSQSSPDEPTISRKTDAKSGRDTLDRTDCKSTLALEMAKELSKRDNLDNERRIK